MRTTCRDCGAKLVAPQRATKYCPTCAAHRHAHWRSGQTDPIAPPADESRALCERRGECLAPRHGNSPTPRCQGCTRYLPPPRMAFAVDEEIRRTCTRRA